MAWILKTLVTDVVDWGKNAVTGAVRMSLGSAYKTINNGIVVPTRNWIQTNILNNTRITKWIGNKAWALFDALTTKPLQNLNLLPK